MRAVELTVVKTDGAARAGRLRTPHGEVETPAFMPVGTQAAVKGVHHDDVRAAGAELLLANTYHLMLRPSAERVAALGGLHTFMGWPGPILTDSGGFQVFSLGALRNEVARREKLIPEGVYAPLWVVEFPMFEYHEEDGRYYSMHHPFTSPVDEDLPLLERAVEGGETELLGKIRTNAYDPVINGVELASGSIRIHRRDVQRRLEVDEALPGGLALYGARFGRYPVDPTVLFVRNQ
jgi:hypothetical protein